MPLAHERAVIVGAVSVIARRQGVHIAAVHAPAVQGEDFFNGLAVEQSGESIHSSSVPRQTATVKRFSKAELAAFAGRSVDDLLGDHVRLLIVGINPGLWTAAVNAHFARAGNRFWPALHAAGITPHRIDASGGMAPADADLLRSIGVGITNISPVATARADELTRQQLREGAERLTALVERLQPLVVAVLGISAYRLAFGLPATTVGPQPHRLADCELWVLPNPSGLNAHATLAVLAQWYGQAADAAGIPRDRPRSGPAH